MKPLSPPYVPIGARRAVAYLRVSSDKQGASIAQQKAAIELYAAQHGFVIVKWYIDDAVSGASVDGRQAFKQMQLDAKAPGRDWQFVLVYDVSRFSRGNLDEAGHLRHEFFTLGVEIVYTNEALTGGDADELVVNVKQWMAQRYVVDLSKTTLRGQLSVSASGAWCGGAPGYGYDLLYSDSSGRPYQRVRWLENGDKEIYDPAGKLTRVLPRGERLTTSKQDRATLVPSTPERVSTIQRIFRECVNGMGYRAIADNLNRDGIPSPRDGSWSANKRGLWTMMTIRAILRNPCYRGDLAWARTTSAKFHKVKAGVAEPRSRFEAGKPRENDPGNWVVVPNAHEALVPPTVFDHVQALMKSRGQNVGAANGRAGSGLRSPFLLSSLIRCGRCGANYQGRTINSTKRRRDGSKIVTRYYCCTTWVARGRSACEKLMLRRDPLEDLLVGVVQERVRTLVAGDGEKLLRQYIAEELASQGADPRREIAQLHARIREIEHKASVLLDGISAETTEFVNTKLRELGNEKRRHQGRIEELETAPYTPIDADVVLAEGLAGLADLSRLMDRGTLEERKQFIRSFITGVTVQPDTATLDVTMRTFPAVGDANSACALVAGAGFEPATFGL